MPPKIPKKFEKYTKSDTVLAKDLQNIRIDKMMEGQRNKGHLPQGPKQKEAMYKNPQLKSGYERNKSLAETDTSMSRALYDAKRRGDRTQLSNETQEELNMIFRKRNKK